MATATTTAAASSIPPNQTLYVSNLNDKIRKPDLRLSLYTLFSTYGIVLDVVALKTPKHRGQAHIAFRDIPSATQAMRALQGMNVFGKDMRIAYAKGKSHKIAKLDGTFRMPTSAAAAAQEIADAKVFVPLPGTVTTNVASAPVVASGAGAGLAAPGVVVMNAASPAEAQVGQKRLRDEESDGEEAEMEMEDDDDD